MTSNNFLAIIIPMYNEEKVADKCISSVLKQIKKERKGIKIIVVDDGSRDKTPEILSKWLAREKKFLNVVTHEKNKGYGGAINSGIQKALGSNYEYCLTMDSDLTNNPKYIPDFIEASTHGYDCIKASRYIGGSRIINVPYHRKVISRVGNLIASYLFNVGINDCTNGFRMARLLLLKGYRFKEKNFSIILEEMHLLKKRGAKFTEIPYTLIARTNSASHFSYKPSIFYDYFKYVVLSVFVH